MDSFATAWKAVVGMVVIVTLVIGGVMFAMYNNARNGVIARESALSAQYLDNQNQLSAYINTVKESMGVANTATEAVDTIIGNAIKGRYADESSAGGTVEANTMVQAVFEAYPDLQGVTINYGNVQNAIIGGREAFKNHQAKLLDMIREYDTWRKSGIIHSMIVSWVGAPTDDLVAVVGEKRLTGSEALEEMRSVVLSLDAQNAFATGEDKALDTGDMRLNDKGAEDAPVSGQ